MYDGGGFENLDALIVHPLHGIVLQRYLYKYETADENW